ncbi:unnamed protein product [Blepharisma stoltei]|uniref:Uncharacterized protein n=1 Tax=Blepharisma stoltei TaxID=1481888 RepID=A0AAU9JNH3_9CILI|nr:unnamed protein product [Blepharisma stoltei]
MEEQNDQQNQVDNKISPDQSQNEILENPSNDKNETFSNDSIVNRQIIEISKSSFQLSNEVAKPESPATTCAFDGKKENNTEHTNQHNVEIHEFECNSENDKGAKKKATEGKKAKDDMEIKQPNETEQEISTKLASSHGFIYSKSVEFRKLTPRSQPNQIHYARPDPFQQLVNLRTPSGTLTSNEGEKIQDVIDQVNENHREGIYTEKYSHISSLKSFIDDDIKTNEYHDERHVRTPCFKCIVQ